MQRFIMAFMEPIIASSLHIYYSALVLAPSDTELSCRYGHFAEGGIRVVRGRADGWSQTLWTATKHSGTVSCIAISPDEMAIISGSHDNTLRLWDAKTGAAIGKAMEGHTSWVSCIAVSADGMTIVSGSGDNTLCLWDAKTGAAIGKAMEGHTSWVNCIAVSADGMTIVSGSHDNTLCLWDAKTGAAIGKAMEGHTSWVNCIAVSADGMIIVSGSDDKTLHLWDVKTGAAIGKAMEGHTYPVNSVAFSHDGKYIISESIWVDETLTWNYITGTQLLGMEAHQALKTTNLPFTLDTAGWVQGPSGKQTLWLLADLRGAIVSQGNIVVMKNPKIPIFSTSGCVS
ncbi:hypothetical protein FRB94_006044 [Tulasnella sp. JGI-2019a]|nr:hypothetical protein FRB94_006044 [Tulasnella sp. JGI-2019a]